jgi:sugar-specific transcriptional regulator TrmB
VERRNLTPQEKTVYRFVLRSGQTPFAEVEEQPGGKEALAYLIDFGLLAVDPQLPDVVAAVDPSLAARQQSSRTLDEVMRDLGWISSLPASTSDLAEEYRAAQQGQSGATEIVRGLQAIGQRLELMLVSSRTRMLTIHPEETRPEAALEAVVGRDLEVIRRGVDVRGIYLSPVRRQATVRAYIEAVTAAGAEFRTLPKLPIRQFVIDDVAILPHPEENGSAVFIKDPSTVQGLVDHFEYLWAQADEFTGRTTGDDPVDETLLSVMRMLVDGASTRKMARALGVSERMVTRLRADINEKFGTDAAVRLGWLLHQHFPNGIK